MTGVQTCALPICMINNAGIAAGMFEALSNSDINIQMISSSEIKISVLIDKKDADRAIQAIHDQWGVLCAAAHHIISVNADYKRLDSEAAALLAQSVGVSVPNLACGLHHLANVVKVLDHPSSDLLEALKPNEEAQRLTPLQAMVATHYQGGEFDYIKTRDDAKNVGDGLFTFCINEAGDAGGKSELVNMLNRAIEQLRSLVGELETEK